MTTIDHQQAAIDAGAEAIYSRDIEYDYPNEEMSELVLAAATPHLRAEWEQELARAVKRLPWNGVTHGGTMVPLDSVLALLEGGGK